MPGTPTGGRDPLRQGAHPACRSKRAAARRGRQRGRHGGFSVPARLHQSRLPGSVDPRRCCHRGHELVRAAISAATACSAPPSGTTTPVTATAYAPSITASAVPPSIQCAACATRSAVTPPTSARSSTTIADEPTTCSKGSAAPAAPTLGAATDAANDATVTTSPANEPAATVRPTANRPTLAVSECCKSRSGAHGI